MTNPFTLEDLTQPITQSSIATNSSKSNKKSKNIKTTPVNENMLLKKKQSMLNGKH